MILSLSLTSEPFKQKLLTLFITFVFLQLARQICNFPCMN